MKTKSLSTISLMDRPRVQAREDAVLRTSWPCGNFPGSASFISSHITQEMVEAFNLLFDTVLSKREPLFFLPAILIHADKAFTEQIFGSELKPSFFLSPRTEGFSPTSYF